MEIPMMPMGMDGVAASDAAEESDLAARLARGDGEAEQELASRYHARFLRQAQQGGVPHPDYEDVAHEALLGLLEQVRRGAFREEAQFDTWARSIAANKIADHWRKHTRDSRRLLQPPAELPGSEGDALDAIAEAVCAAAPDAALSIDVRRALAAISPDYCVLLILHRTYGYSATQLSQLPINNNQWTKKQIEDRLGRAQEHFRRALPAYQERTRKGSGRLGSVAHVASPEEEKENGRSKQTRDPRHVQVFGAGRQRLAHRLLFWARHTGAAKPSRGAFTGMFHLSQ